MSCCGCLSQPARITNIYRDDDLLVKFTDLTGIQVVENTFICDPCIELLDISAGFKERCLEIFSKSLSDQEDAAGLQEDELVYYETEEFVDEPVEDIQIEHSEGDPFHEAELDEDLTLFAQDLKPGTRSSCAVPVIRESTEQPSTSRKKNNSVEIKEETEESTVPENSTSSPEGNRSKAGKSRMSYTSSKKLEAVKYAELVGNRQAAKAFFIDESCVRKWRAKKSELMEIDSERRTKRKPNLHWPELDKLLRHWAQEQLAQGGGLKPSMIKAKAFEFAASLDLTDFKGTSSYVFKFMQRYRIPGSKGSSKVPPDQ